MTKISKIVSYGYRQTKALSKTATKEVIGVGKLPLDVKTGYQTAKRLAEIKEKTPIQKTQAIGTGIIRMGIVPHLPGILAGVGTVIPVLGSSAAGLAIGKILQKALKKI